MEQKQGKRGLYLTKFGHRKFFKEDKGWDDKKIESHWQLVVSDDSVPKSTDMHDSQLTCFIATECYIDIAEILSKSNKMIAGQAQIKRPKKDDFEDYHEAMLGNSLGKDVLGVSSRDLAKTMGFEAALSLQKDLSGNMPTDDEFLKLLDRASMASGTDEGAAEEAEGSTGPSEGSAAKKLKANCASGSANSDDDLALACTAQRSAAKAKIEGLKAELALADATAKSAGDFVKNEAEKHPEEVCLMQCRLLAVAEIQNETPGWKERFEKTKEDIAAKDARAVDWSHVEPLAELREIAFRLGNGCSSVLELNQEVEAFNDKVEKTKKLGAWLKASASELRRAKANMDRQEQAVRKKAEDAARHQKNNTDVAKLKTHGGSKSWSNLDFNVLRQLCTMPPETTMLQDFDWGRPVLIDTNAIRATIQNDKLMRLNIAVFSTSLQNDVTYQETGTSAMSLKRLG